nr:hypothetical protein [Tanacetum cinerariifolium]
MKSGIKSVNAARQKFSKAALTVKTARPVNTVHPKTTMNAAKPRPKAVVNTDRPKVVLNAIKGNEFWTTTKSKTVNEEVQIHALVDGMKGRIDKIDADEDIALVSTHDDVIVQDEGIEDVGEEEVVEVVTTVKMLIDTVIDVAQVTTAIVDILISAAETIVTAAPTITVESTKTNVEVSKRKGVMIKEPEETITTTKIASSQQPQVQVKGKGKGKAKLSEEPEMPKKQKHQIRADEELAVKLQAKIDEEDRQTREKTQQVKEVNLAWDDVEATIKADYELA